MGPTGGRAQPVVGALELVWLQNWSGRICLEWCLCAEVVALVKQV